MTAPLPIKRALVSLSDKANLDTLIEALTAADVEIISTGGTAKAIAALGASVTPVESVTGFPEIMDGRVKTLHPNIHAALLANRAIPEHLQALEQHAITPIDLLVVNLYPFEQTVAAMARGEGGGLEDAIENIDIGGPAMIRAAAKNHDHIAVVTDPKQYDAVIAEIRSSGAIALDTRRRLAADAFARTAAYDSAITNFLASRPEYAPPTDGDDAPDEPLPHRIAVPLIKVRDLRYGENPHQAAALYRTDAPEPESIEYGALATARQLHGKPLSYNNLLDANAALALARDLFALRPGEHAAVVVKHTNPCGAAVAHSPRTAIDAALAGDPLAAYGGILATTSTITADAAERLARKGTFLEVIIARAFEDDALSTLTARSKNLRLLRAAPKTAPGAQDPARNCNLRTIDGGFLAQTRNDAIPDSGTWTLAAGAAADDATLRAAEIVWAFCKHLSSNAIAIGGFDDPSEPTGAVRLFGAGAGQMDRVASCRIAVEKAASRTSGAIAASDAFFPFSDGPQVLIDAGVRTIIHPGGSKRDADTFDLCGAHDVSCYTTGQRHFRH